MIEKVMPVITWVQLNYIQAFTFMGASVLFLEVAVRFTPTKKDDGFIKRLGNAVDKFFDIVHFPNIHSVEFKGHIKGEKNGEVPKQP